MKLAKNAIDVGIYTNQREAQLTFWQEEVGLPFDELLKVGGGTHQLRHDLNGSVFSKIPIPWVLKMHLLLNFFKKFSYEN